jgi:hypothetical protein
MLDYRDLLNHGAIVDLPAIIAFPACRRQPVGFQVPFSPQALGYRLPSQSFGAVGRSRPKLEL